jgi:hypothetical protein
MVWSVAAASGLSARRREFVFLAERTAEQQEEIVLAFVDMVATYIERFATPMAIEGISTEEFVRVLTEGSGTAASAPGVPASPTNKT